MAQGVTGGPVLVPTLFPDPNPLGPASGAHGAVERLEPGSEPGPRRAPVGFRAEPGSYIEKAWRSLRWVLPPGPMGACSARFRAGERGCGHWPRWKAGSAGSRPAACGSESEKGIRNSRQHRASRSCLPRHPAGPGSPVLTSLCSLRSSSLRLLLTFMSCCTLARRRQGLLQLQVLPSVTAPSGQV